MNRDEALQIVNEYTKNQNLVKHMLAVEAAMRFYAQKFGEDEEKWAVTGLIHDFDYEKYPNAAHHPTEEHPAWGVRLLQENGCPADVCEAILGHGDYTGVPRETQLAKTLYACDELTGLVVAVALVRPSRKIAEVDVEAVKRKWSDKSFARGVKREDIELGAKELGIPLDVHIQNVITAMQGISSQLGL
ncbi:HDIG domain-containing protein [Candidatus Acetothermia bacterium]|nr:HDIG domain-containing protein [Candidatus Acetothermia bacterium]MBI3644043.1 HDIG domain-containing protein [Candidatus Acetothermia bacterium]